MSSPITVDIETYSPADLKEVGAYRYAQDPDYQLLLISASGETMPVETNDVMQSGVTESMRATLFAEDAELWAYNAQFEWWCLSEHFGLTREERDAWLEHWNDSMLHALYCGLPGNLKGAGEALRLGEDKAKMKEGRALISYFCVPCRPTKANGGRTRNLPEHSPERWELFKAYNARDVEAEAEIDRKLAAWPVPKDLMAAWREDVRMNAYGIAVDRGLVEGALACAQQMNQEWMAESRTRTGLSNPNSRAQLLEWLEGRGLHLEDLTKGTVDATLARNDLPGDIRRVLELRQLLSKTSTSKYDVAYTASDIDGRIRGCLQFYGANRTGRWAGRVLQPQNLPRTYIKAKDQPYTREIIRRRDVWSLQELYDYTPMDVLSQMIRTVLVPTQGHKFIDADFSAIEARLIAYLAQEEWVLDVFRTTGKIYEATAARIFGVDFDTIVKGNPNYKYRQRGKVATLALGYQGGIAAMKRMGGDQLGLDDAGLQDIVDRWRAQNPRICKLWRRMQDCAVRTISTGTPTQPRPGIVMRLERSTACPFPFLTVQLLSGRKLFYANPGLTPDGRITYWENNQGAWSESESYGGKLTENLTQAIGADCLSFALGNLKRAGYRVVFHVHDEVIIESATQDAAADLRNVIKIMSQVPPWAEGLPLNADGWTGDFFTKD